MNNFTEAIAEADLNALSGFCGYQWQKEEYESAKPTYPVNVKYHIDSIMGPRSMYWHTLLKGATPVFDAEPQEVNFLHFGDVPINTKWKTTKAKLTNVIVDDLSKFVDKDSLATLCQSVPQTIPSDDVKFEEGSVWIIKPVGSGAESGIAVQAVSTQKALDEARQFIASKSDWRAIASRYILRPALFKGFKFHVRGFIAVRSWAPPIAAPFGGIYLAAKQYSADNWEDRDIHISHYSANPTAAIYPDDVMNLPQGALMVAGFRAIMKELCGLLPTASGENGHSYEILAPDVMFDEDGRAWLLEINRGAGKSVDSPGRSSWDKHFVQWEFGIIEPILERNRHRYWLFSGARADYTHMKKLMQTAGMEPYPDTEYTKDGELIYTEQKIPSLMPFYLNMTSNIAGAKRKGFDRNTYSMQGQIQNILDLHLCPINDKGYLHGRPEMHGWVASTVALDDYVFDGKPAICRPVGIAFSSGIGIKYIQTANDLPAAKKYYADLIAKEQRAGRKCSVIVSEYLSPLCLWRGRKFHLRIYMIVSGYAAAVENVRVAHFGEIIPAKLPFVAGDYSNMDIHDTHAGSDPDNEWYYPQDFEPSDKVPEINAHLDRLAVTMTPIVAPLRTYPQFSYGYVIYGMDIMVMEDYSIRVIEINDRPDLQVKKFNANSDEHYRELGEFEFTYGIKPGL